MMTTALGVFMRLLHISSVIIALGGVFYARCILYPALARASEADRQAVLDSAGARFAPWIWIALAAAVISGFYNFFTKPFYPPGYHMWFGIKFLLALHVIAVLALLARPGGNMAKRGRWMTGLLFSGGIIVVVSAYMRWISVNVLP